MVLPAIGASSLFSKVFSLKGLLIIAAVVAVVFAIKIGIDKFEDNIRNDERTTIENAQLKQAVKEQEDLLGKLEELKTATDDIYQRANAVSSRTIERHTEVRSYIENNKEEAQKNQSSDIIKTTIRMLKDE